MKNKSQQHVLGSLIIIILLLLAAIPALMFVSFTDITKADIIEDYEHGWEHYIQFTIDHDYINEDLTAFPVLVVIPTAVGSQADNGDSIRFLKEDLTEVYYHEIELWNGAGDSYVWVRINQTLSAEDTNVVMFYGNATATDTSSANTWDDNFIAVYHMNSTGAGTTVWDSTLNRHGTKNATGEPANTASGIIDGAQDFELTTSDFVTATKVGAILNLTVEAWYTPEASDGNVQAIVENTYRAAAGQKGFLIWRHDDNHLRFEVQKSVAMFSLIDPNVWQNTTAYVAGVLSDENYGRLYMNDTLVASDESITGNMTDYASAKLRIGVDKLTNSPLVYRQWADGIIDEVRISDIARSDTWIKASFNSQNQTTGFFTWNGGIDSGIVRTNTTTNIGTTSATLNSYLQFNGSARTWYGIRYGLSEDSLTNNVTVGTNGANYTAFNYDATGLNEGTLYYIQAWANNSNGFSTGTTKTFWTNSTWANSSLNNRTRIVINHTFIDEDLYDFPVLVTINSTVGQYCDSGNSIRFYKNSTTQYYYEIDTWNTSENSSVWVNVTLVYKDVDTVFYMYYNDTNAVSNSSGPNTWNGNYLGVYHLNESVGSTCFDSTSNGNDATYNGSLPTRIVFGVGYGQDFDGDNDYIDLPVEMFSSGLEPLTLEILFDSDIIGGGFHQRILALSNATSSIQAYSDADGKWNVAAYTGSALWDDATVDSNTYKNYIAYAWDEDSDYTFRTNTTQVYSKSSFTFIDFVPDVTAYIGIHVDNTTREVDGKVDEIRFSNVRRSNGWTDASFHSQNQTPGFITFTGEEEERPIDAFVINGLSENRITWQGQPNSYAWCNATGTANETMEINMTINATTNITKILIWVGDSNDTGNYLNASNISVVFSSDNTTWNLLDVNTTSFVDGGSNVTLNVSRWNDTNGMYGTNPFNGTGLTDKTASIYCRFRLDILTTQAVDIYWNSTVWKVYIGYIV